jgi:hypothetical protein
LNEFINNHFVELNGINVIAAIGEVDNKDVRIKCSVIGFEIAVLMWIEFVLERSLVKGNDLLSSGMNIYKGGLVLETR